MSIRIDETEYGANPWAFTSSRYAADGQVCEMERSLVRGQDLPREAGLRLWTLTSAFDTSAEAGSVTCPSKVPDRGLCAKQQRKTNK